MVWSSTSMPMALLPWDEEGDEGLIPVVALLGTAFEASVVVAVGIGFATAPVGTVSVFAVEVSAGPDEFARLGC